MVGASYTMMTSSPAILPVFFNLRHPNNTHDVLGEANIAHECS